MLSYIPDKEGLKMNNKGRYSTFISRDGSISVEAYVANGHGVHTNLFPVNYEEMKDIPDDILFRTNSCLISSAYHHLLKKQHILSKDGLTIDTCLNKIIDGLLRKKRDGLCHSDLATKDSVLTYLKYVNNSEVKKELRVFNFDELLDFEINKTQKLIKAEEELDLFNQIISLNNIRYGFIIIDKLLSLENISFRDSALLLLKCKVYDIEDKHYLETKMHDKDDVDALKVYARRIYPQIK